MSFFKSKVTARHILSGSVYSPDAMQRCFSSPSPKKSDTKHRNETTTFYQHLLQITLTDNKFMNQRLECALHDQLMHGWNISHSTTRTFYRLKPISEFIQSVIVIESLHDTLLYSFNTFLDLKKKPNITDYDWRVRWAYATYSVLIDSMTLEQKAMIFCKCSNRKNRKYKLIHKYKDCIIGKEGVDFLVAHQISKNRKAAIDLGQEFIDKGYMAHVVHKHGFKDSNNLWYRFYDANIKYKHDHLMRYSDEYKYEESTTITMDVDDDDHSNASSDEDDNGFLLRDIENGIHSTAKCDEMKVDLGARCTAVIEWLLSLHSMNDLQCLLEDDLRGLIKPPQMALSHSSTPTVDSECIVPNTMPCIDSQPSVDELFMGYHHKMTLKMSNKYYLNVKPISMKQISNQQRTRLMKVQTMTFDTYSDALQFVLCSLWDIYEDMSRGIYLKLVDRLCLVEKAKMLSIGVETRNRIRNLKKYRQCFVGSEAVTFCMNSKLVSSRAGGVRLGNMFHQKNWIKHVKNEYGFEDKDLLYAFVDDELQNRLDELRLYRKQQQSNHVKLSLDIVASPRTLLYAEESVDSDEILIDWNESTKSDNNDSYDFVSLTSNMELKPPHKRTKSFSFSLDVEPFYD
eukprot:35863_1